MEKRKYTHRVQFSNKTRKIFLILLEHTWLIYNFTNLSLIFSFKEGIWLGESSPYREATCMHSQEQKRRLIRSDSMIGGRRVFRFPIAHVAHGVLILTHTCEFIFATHEWVGRKRKHAHIYVDTATGEADPRLRQGSGRFVAAVEEQEEVATTAAAAAAAADGFIDWHCRHRPKKSVSGVRELRADGVSRFSWSWIRGRFLPRWKAESRVLRRATYDQGSGLP